MPQTRNERYRRIYWNPPGFYHWNNHDDHDGLGRWFLDQNGDRDKFARHVTGNTLQMHYYWAGLHDTPNNWEGIRRRDGQPLPGELGMNVRIRVSFEMSNRTAGSCALMVQSNLGSYYSTNENHEKTVDISSTSASQFYGFAFVPSTDFDGTVSLPIVHSIQQLG